MNINNKARLILSFMLICINPLIEKSLGQDQPKYAPGSLIVKFSNSAAAQPDYRIRIEKAQVITGLPTIDSLCSKFAASSFRPFYREIYNPIEYEKLGRDRLFILQFPAKADMEIIADIYSKDPNIEKAYPSYLFFVEVTPNDPYYNTQWALPKISAPSAWGVCTGDSSIIIGILDTGVDLDHPDLQSKLTSSGLRRDEVDIITENYIEAGYTLDPFEDYTTPDNVPQDRHGHGTHVAGIAAAATNNDTGVAGVAWYPKIMPLKAFFWIYHPTKGWHSISEAPIIANLIDWAINTGEVDVMNMSFGSYSQTFKSEIESEIASAYNAGITLVASSGNDGTSNEFYPAAFDNYVIAVGATNQNDTRCTFSNYGSWLDVVAPGDDIRSTVYDNTYSYMDGTSMAAPHVAALAGLMLSLDPDLTVEEITMIITGSADKVGDDPYDNNCWNEKYGYGRINAYEALTGLDYLDEPPATPFAFKLRRSGNHPKLTWLPNLEPDLDGYEIYRKEGTGSWGKIANRPACATSFTDRWIFILEYNPDIVYYKMRAYDKEGLYSGYTPTRYIYYNSYPKMIRDTSLAEALPATYAFYSAYPNPFNPATTIRYDLPEASNTTLTIYDIMGREVIRWEQHEEPGFKQLLWDGKDHSGQLVPAGIYIYRLSAASLESEQHFTDGRKMVLLK